MTFNEKDHPCDATGCSAGNQYLGILPGQEYNFIGFQYNGSYFSGSYPSLYENQPYQHSTDAYRTFQLWGRYNIGRHYQVFAFIPYQYNSHNEDSTHFTSSGLGDASLLVNRIFIKTENRKLNHLLQAGAGIKLPTGAHTGLSQLDKEGLPNMQPGTGSADVVTNANYTMRYKKLGVNMDGAYTFTMPNRENYKYGNRLSMGINGFYPISTVQFSLLPQAGLRYEYTLHDYDNYSRKWLNESSGGYICYASAGIQAYIKKTGFSFTCQLPVSQYYGSGYVTAKVKVETGIFLLF